jgi:hypothetical protein
MENDKTPIRADISLSVHPDSLLNVAKDLNVPGTPGEALYKVARLAIAPLYDAMGQMVDARKAMYSNVPPNAPKVMGRADPKTGEGGHMIPITGREQELRNAMQAAFDRAARTSDHQYKTLMSMRDNLARSIETKLTYPKGSTSQGIAEAAEIRTMVRTMSRKDRNDYIEDILDQGDQQQLSAILHGPRHLSGLSKVEHDQLRRFAAQKLAPVESKQLSASDEAINTIMRAGMAFHTRHLELQPPGPKKDDPNSLDGALNKLRTGKV